MVVSIVGGILLSIVSCKQHQEAGRGPEQSNEASSRKITVVQAVDEPSVPAPPVPEPQPPIAVDPLPIPPLGYYPPYSFPFIVFDRRHDDDERKRRPLPLRPGCVEGSMQRCGTDVGECRFGTKTCVNGVLGPCVGGQGPVAEVCNGADDDCDTLDDEGLICSLRAFMTSAYKHHKSQFFFLPMYKIHQKKLLGQYF